MPYENAPEVNPPIFPLIKDFPKTIVFSNNSRVEDTVDSCQYTCNDGYRVSSGACGVGSAGGAVGFSCTVAPTLVISAPTGAITGVAATLKLNTARTGVTVETGGSGYTASPVVTVNIPNNGTCTPYTPAIGTTVSAGSITTAIFKVATPTVEVSRGALITDKLVFAVTNGGAGYSATNQPVVTIG